MRVLAFTDPHGSLGSALSILKLAKESEPDLIVCAGDFSYLGTRFDGFLTKLKDLHREILFVPGNHETEEAIENVQLWYPFMKDMTFRVEERGELLIAGLPATMEFAPGDRVDQEAVDQTLDLWGSVDKLRPLVLLSHYPPWQSAISGMTTPAPDSGGSMTVKRIIEALKPALVICGHYHQDFGKSDQLGPTRLINPGPDGMIIEI